MSKLEKLFIVLSLFSGVLLDSELLFGLQAIGTLYSTVFLASLAAQSVSVLLAFLIIRKESTYLGLAVPLWLLFPLSVSLLPPTATDALVHHLAVPKMWLEAGRIHEITWHEWSYYPMLLGLAYTGFLQLDLEIFTGPYHLSFLLQITGCLLILSNALGFEKKTKLFTILLCLTLPVFIRLSTVQLVDLALGFYSTLAVLLMALAYKSDNMRALSFGAGLAFGLACATKYNGYLLSALALSSFFILFITQRKKIRVLQSFSLLAVGLAIVIGPWLYKNYLWTANPIFPLFRSFFAVTEQVSGGISALSPLLHRHILYEESWLELILLPVRIFIFGSDGSPRTFDGILFPSLLLGIVIIGRKESGITKTLSCIAILYVLLALFFSPARARYLLPVLPVLLLLSSHVLSQFRQTSRFLVDLIMLGQVFIGVTYLSHLFKTENPIPFLSGKITREQYLTEQVSEYGLISEVNRKLTHENTIYLLATGNKFYYFDIPVLSRGYFSMTELVAWLRSDTDILIQMQKLGVTHIFTHTGRLQSSLLDLQEREEREKWNAFSREHLEPVFGYGEYSLWKIKA